MSLLPGAGLFLLVILSSGVPMSAQASSQDVGITQPRAPVVIDGDALFAVRGVLEHPAERRAAEVEARIRALAGDPTFTDSSLGLDDQPGVTWIVANGRRVVSVFDDEAAHEGMDRRALADAYRRRVAGAVAAYREARRPAVLWRHALLAVGATLALMGAAWLGRRFIRRLQSGIERRYGGRVQDVHVHSFQVVRAEQIWRAIGGVLNLLWMLLMLAMVFVYLRYTLGLFPWTRGTGLELFALVVEPLKNLGLEAVRIIPNAILLAVLFLVTRYVLSLTRLFFKNVSAGKVTLQGFDADLALPTHRLVRFAIIALAVVVAYPYVPGSHTDAFKGVTLFMGVLFSLGSSSFVGNLIAGYSLIYRRTFRPGHVAKIGDHIGVVTEMRLLVTHLRTPKNEEVIVPNSEIVNSEVVNYTSMAKAPGVILHTTVGIGYETPWRQVEAMLLEAARRTPGLLTDPPPFVLQTALGDFAVTYEINVYCSTPELMKALYSELHRNILDAFNEYGVQIMTPAYEGDPERPKVVPKDRWHTEPAPPPKA